MVESKDGLLVSNKILYLWQRVDLFLLQEILGHSSEPVRWRRGWAPWLLRCLPALKVHDAVSVTSEVSLSGRQEGLLTQGWGFCH